jgi:DNA-binding response OmpR family regulator
LKHNAKLGSRIIVEVGDASPEQDKTMTSLPPNGARPVVLLAEDEAIIALELEDSLKAAGFDIAGPFSTCADAERWLKSGRPAAAVLDSALKDGPCETLARELKARGVPVVIYSGYARGEDPYSSAWDGSWLVKPVAFPMLLSELEQEMTRAA